MDDNDYYSRRYYPPSSKTSSAVSDNEDEDDSRLGEMCSNFAFVFTIFIIIALQFREPIVRWYHTTVFRLRYMSLGEYVAEQWWTLLDFIRGVWFMGLEILRNSADLLMPVHEAGETSSPLPHPRLQLRRRMNQYHQHRNTPLPELLEDDNNNDDDYDRRTHLTGATGETKGRNGTSSSGRARKWNQRELEPAFLKDSDYPDGWMVFHPILGVVSKEEADKYNNGESKWKEEEDNEIRESVPPAVTQLHFASNGENGAMEPRVVEKNQFKDDDDNSSRDRSHSPIGRERASGIPHLRSIAASG